MNLSYSNFFNSSKIAEPFLGNMVTNNTTQSGGFLGFGTTNANMADPNAKLNSLFPKKPSLIDSIVFNSSSQTAPATFSIGNSNPPSQTISSGIYSIGSSSNNGLDGLLGNKSQVGGVTLYSKPSRPVVAIYDPVKDTVSIEDVKETQISKPVSNNVSETNIGGGPPPTAEEQKQFLDALDKPHRVGENTYYPFYKQESESNIGGGPPPTAEEKKQFMEVLSRPQMIGENTYNPLSKKESVPEMENKLLKTGNGIKHLAIFAVLVLLLIIAIYVAGKEQGYSIFEVLYEKIHIFQIFISFLMAGFLLLLYKL